MNKEFVERRQKFLNDNKNNDFAVINGNCNIIISAPHGVSQTRLGKHKVAEIGALSLALELQKKTDCYLIAKTKNNFDDANFDEKSSYRSELKNIIEKNKMNFLIDFHGLSSFRQMDINYGTNYGHNISRNIQAFDELKNLCKTRFTTTVDQPFSGGIKTVSGAFSKYLWTLQLEINCAITNDIRNKNKLIDLINVLEKWINYLKTLKV